MPPINYTKEIDFKMQEVTVAHTHFLDVLRADQPLQLGDELDVDGVQVLSAHGGPSVGPGRQRRYPALGRDSRGTPRSRPRPGLVAYDAGTLVVQALQVVVPLFPLDPRKRHGDGQGHNSHLQRRGLSLSQGRSVDWEERPRQGLH